jgi:acyl-CoA dehydrogenase
VNGRKVWNTNARQATHMLLLARTAPRDPAKPFRGLTLFFTPFDRSKITVREIEKLGGRPSTPTRSSSMARDPGIRCGR